MTIIKNIKEYLINLFILCDVIFIMAAIGVGVFPKSSGCYNTSQAIVDGVIMGIGKIVEFTVS